MGRLRRASRVSFLAFWRPYATLARTLALEGLSEFCLSTFRRPLSEAPTALSECFFATLSATARRCTPRRVGTACVEPHQLSHFSRRQIIVIKDWCRQQVLLINGN